ncbi:helix-turn-helix transcriptional regulator [Catenuloplanes japonicus]|uniref:helix-turn-helix transcriptional regulator n=1 Tax=Catenuloplanes japonicus TaxID=33876 RepID=UPI0005268805|nr:helix-turn-helix transcriptional regulator [Catenuloplanes japonicus]
MANNPETRADVRDFLISARSRITPHDAGLPAAGRRRVPGLRREEVAVLAGISTDWYTRLEKGSIDKVSDDVIGAVARALRLNDEERVYLFALARAARQTGKGVSRPREPQPPSQLQWMLDSMTLAAAMISDARQDILAVNALGRALHAPVFDSPTTREHGHANLARYHFLDPGAPDFYGDWHATADMLTASLRAEAGRDPHNTRLRHLVGELSTRSPEFRTRWAAHDIRIHISGTKTFQHPAVGRLTLSYHSMDLPTPAPSPQQHVCVCTAEPGSTAEDQLRLLTLVPHSAQTAHRV